MPSKKFAPIQWTYGTLITDDPEALAREERSKELYGFAQVERVQRGEEKPPSPARLKADRSRAEAAAALPLKVVGTPTIDLYAREKVTGRARYPVDIYPTGVLYTKVLRSPYPHAKVTRLDTSDAERMPGVRAIVTYADMPRIARPPLTDEPSFAGEGIAAVAAETEGIAEAALRAIKVEYEQLPFVLDPREAAKPGAPLVRSDLRTNHVRDPQFSNKRGDVERGFAQADIVVESKSQTSWEQHVAMEPHSATAMWEADDRLTVWSSTQYAHGMRNGIASALAMPQSKVRVLAEHTGSGWGDKTGLLPYHVYTALLAKKAGRPVRYELNRKDVFVEAGHNYPKYQEIRLGFKRDGTITAMQGVSWVPAGSRGAPGNGDDWESALRVYKIPNVDVQGFSVRTNTVTASPLRSVGEPAGVFSIEILMDQAAEKLNMDPLELRLKNIEEKVDQVTNLPFSSNGLREALERGAEAFGWKQKWQGWNRQRDLTKPQRGVGMACFSFNKGGQSPPMTAIVQIETDGSVRMLTGAADIGGGQATTWSMIVAETLGVPLSQVTISRMDTAAGSDSGGIFGSRGTKSVGMAALRAAQEARKELLQGAAFNLKVKAEELDIADAVVFVKSDPTKKLTFAQAAAAGVVIVDDIPRTAAGTIIGEAKVPPPTGYSQKTFGAGFYEVEVDPGTGNVRVLRVVQAHDVGKAINPLAVENQIHGGIMHAMNKALTEELIYDPSTGVLVNPNLDDYKLHMIDATPTDIKVVLVEPIDVLGPYGAKGIGEPANGVGQPSIANAIYDAIGARLTEVPMNPYRVMKAVKAV